MAQHATIHEAAEAMNKSPKTLRTWIGRGAPVVQHGRRGRGCPTIVNIEALRKWRQAQPRAALPVDSDDAIMALARTLPDRIAEALFEVHRAVEGPDKRRAAAFFVAAFVTVTTGVLDALREHHADVPELRSLPDQIARLRAISGDSVR